MNFTEQISYAVNILFLKKKNTLLCFTRKLRERKRKHIFVANFKRKQSTKGYPTL